MIRTGGGPAFQGSSQMTLSYTKVYWVGSNIIKWLTRILERLNPNWSEVTISYHTTNYLKSHHNFNYVVPVSGSQLFDLCQQYHHWQRTPLGIPLGLALPALWNAKPVSPGCNSSERKPLGIPLGHAYFLLCSNASIKLLSYLRLPCLFLSTYWKF